MGPYAWFGLARIGLLAILAGVFFWLALGRPITPRLRVVSLALLALSLLSYPNFGRFHPFHYGHVHYWDVYHYFMGAKYFPELGYRGLYEATVVAGRELGAFDYLTHLRDLSTYRLREVGSLDAGMVRERFSRERWASFRHDLTVIGPRIREWRGLLVDHGYNDPPHRALALHLLLRSVPASPTVLTLVTSLDYVLILAMLGAVWWGFGAVPAALAISFLLLGSFPSFDFIGGSILRWDWVAALLLGVSALARGRGALAGAGLAYAALARIFPLVFLVPLIITWFRDRRRPPVDAAVGRCLAVALGGILGVGGAVALASDSVTHLHEFRAKMQLHASMPFSNQVGLGAVLTYASAPWSLDAEGRMTVDQAAAIAARPATLTLAVVTALYAALAWPLLRRASPLESMMYAVPLLYVALSPTGYYYAFLVLLVLLPWQVGRPDRWRLLSMTLLTLLMIAGHAFKLTSDGFQTEFFKASIALGICLLLWLGLEAARLRAPARPSP